jgi:hypothetical protein
MGVRMENYQEMTARHKKEIEALQANCDHSDLTDWLEYHWAPGHFSGQFVRVCKICGKQVESK